MKSTPGLKHTPSELLVQVNLKVPKNKRTQWKHAALDLDMDVKTLVELAVEAYLRQHKVQQ